MNAKRILSILILLVLLLNSSVMNLLGLVSEAIDEIISEKVNENEFKVNILHEAELEKYINYDNGKDKGTLIQFKVNVGIDKEENEEIYLRDSIFEIECPEILGNGPSRAEIIGENFSFENNTVTIQKYFKEKYKYEVPQEYTVILFYDEDCYTDANDERELKLKIYSRYVVDGHEDSMNEKESKKKIIVTENIGTILSSEYETEEIYKGYIDCNITNGTEYETEYKETTKLMISNKEIAPIFDVTASNNFFVNKEETKEKIENKSNLLYKNITFEKSKIENVLGSQGQILILSDDKIIDIINSEIEPDEDGNYIYIFDEPVQNIKLEISNIENEGIIEYTTEKVIKSTLNYSIDGIKNVIEVIGKNKETETTIDEETKEEVKTDKIIEVYKEELSTEVILKDTKENIELNVSEEILLNSVQTELNLTAILKRNSADCKLLENPVIYIEFPQEVEKVIIGSVSVLYDKELKYKENVITTNENGNKVVAISLEGKQTKYLTDSLSNGTNIIIPAIVILKQDIESKDTTIRMTCGEGNYETQVKVINKDKYTVNLAINNEQQSIATGETVDTDGIIVETKSILGNKVLHDSDVVYEEQIIKHVIKITNTTDNQIDNLKIQGKVPEGMTYVTLVEGTFYSERYEYVQDINKKMVEIDVASLEPGKSIEYYYEVQVNDLEDSEDSKETQTEIKVLLGDTDVTTYTLNNTINQAELAIQVIGFINRAKRGQWTYFVKVKNKTEQDLKDVKVEIPISKDWQIDSTIIFDEEELNAQSNIENNSIKVNIGNIGKYVEEQIADEDEGIGIIGQENEAIINFVINNLTVEENENCYWHNEIVATATSQKGITYVSNENRASGYLEAVRVSQVSETSGESIKVNDEVTYTFTIENIGKVVKEFGEFTQVYLQDYLPNELQILEVEYDTNEIKTEYVNGIKVITIQSKHVQEDILSLQEMNENDNTEKPRLNISLNIKTGEKSTVKIKAKVRNQNFDSEIENYAIVIGQNIKTKQTNSIKNIVKGYKIIDDVEDEEQPDKPIDPDNPTNPDPDKPEDTKPDDEETTKKYSISGTVWIDENENGQKDQIEKGKTQIQVLLFDIKANKYVQNSNGNMLVKLTDSEGKYKFDDIKQGQYYVIFMYDNEEYDVTEYKKPGISSSANSDATKIETVIDGKTRVVAMTDTIDLNSNKLNIDLGLIKNKIFDLKIEKYIQKVTVQNAKGTKQYDFNNKFAKVEIPSKQIKGTTLIVEYKLVVTNVGELEGYASEIVDELPTGLEFHSELNSNWFISNNSAKNTSLANKEIKPGESIETTIVLTKTLDDTAQNFKNIAKIGLSNNIKNIEDKNVENDTDSVELLVSISTGKAITYIITVIFTLLLTALLTVGILYIFNKRTNSIGFKTLMILVVIILITPFGFVVCEDDEFITTEDGIYINFKKVDGENVFTGNDGNSYECQSPGEKMCKKDHLFKLDKTYSSVDTLTGKEVLGYTPAEGYDDGNGNIKWTQTITGGVPHINFEKQETEIKYKVVEDGKIYGPFKVKSDKQITIGYVMGIMKDNTAQQQNLTSYKVLNKNLEEASIVSENEFYIKVDKDVCAITLVNARASESAEVSISYHTKVWVHLKCEEVDPEDTWCKENNKVQNMATEQELNKTLKFTTTVHREIIWQPGELPKTIKVEKVDQDDNSIKLKDVEFILQNSELGYVVIDEEDSSVSYVENREDATIFATDENGVVFVEGLKKGTYNFVELKNPNHGYENIKNIDVNREINVAVETALLKYKACNKKLVGEISLEKQSKENSDVKLSGVQFVLKDDNNQYIQVNKLIGLKDAVIGMIEVTEQISVDDKSQATIFVTDDEGKINIKNLALEGKNKDLTDDKTADYFMEEIYNSNYGYEEDGNYIYWNIAGKDTLNAKLSPINIPNNNVQTNDKLSIIVENERKWVRISGYVWEDIANTKDNTRNDLYKQTSNDDKDKLVEGIKVSLINDNLGTRYETFTDKNGAYSFGVRTDDGSYIANILLRDIDNYYLEFEYNGMKYTNVALKTAIEKGSKAVEDNRAGFNNQFSIIADDEGKYKTGEGESSSIAKNQLGQNQCTIYYTQPEEYKSEVTYRENNSNLKNDYYAVDKYHIIASTKASKYNLKNSYTIGDEEVYNVNFGIYEREQVDLAITSDIEQVEVSLNGFTHTYKYGARNSYADAAFNVGVKFGDKYTNRYSRTIYKSAVSYANEHKDVNTLTVYTTYKVTLVNQSTSLKSTINELTNYFDRRYYLLEIYYMDQGTRTGKGISAAPKVSELNDKFIKNKIKLSLDKKLAPGEEFTIYIKFAVQKEAILGLLNENATLDTMTEITSYSVYDKMGSIYASIDEDSAPGNAKIELDANNRLIKTTYEDDTDMAPSLLLQTDKQNIISGTVFEDKALQNILLDKNQRLGNGKYDNGESLLYKVKVELLEVDKSRNDIYLNPTLAKLYQYAEDSASPTNKQKVLDAIVYTDENGNYKFEGILPSEYIIRFTYGENTYILKPGENYSEDSQEVAVRDYKSTIVSSNIIKNALNIDNSNGEIRGNGNYNWYLVEEKDTNNNITKYSDAVDNLKERIELENKPVNNSTINDIKAGTSMSAMTPGFDVGIEFTDVIKNGNKYTSSSQEYDLDNSNNPKLNEIGIPQLNPNFISEQKNVDFGIILRPKVELVIDKEISHTSIKLANGQILMSGDPRTDKMPYTKTGLDDIVFIEMDQELIQGSTLNMKYDITVTNNSEIDFEYVKDTDVTGKKYYYFGTIDDGLAQVNARVEIVGDYLDPELMYDKDKMGEWTEITADELFDKGLISEEVKTALKAGKNTMFITSAFDGELTPGSSKTVSYDVTKLLSSKGDINFSNDVEILQLSGGAARTVYSTTPGNLIPEYPKEADEDSVILVITTPTGGNDNIIYIAVIAVASIILVGGVVFIKRKFYNR